MKKFLILFFLLAFAVCHGEEHRQMINVGVRAYNGVQASYQKWTPTLKYLDESQTKYSFHLVPVFGFEQMRDLVKNKEIDFVITQPAEAVILKEKYDTRIFLTMLNRRNDIAFAYFSAVVFTRADRKDINTVADIKGKKFAAIDPEGFGAYWMGLRELRRAGLHEDKDFKVVFTGTQDKIVDAVMDGTADAGTVRSGILENLIKNGHIKKGSIKVLHPVHDALPLMHSTDLYPEWTLSACGDVSPEAVSTVQRLLTGLDFNSPVLVQSNYGGWILPVNYTSVYDIMKELDKGLYARKPLLRLADIPFFYKILIPLCLVWLAVMGYVAYTFIKK